MQIIQGFGVQYNPDILNPCEVSRHKEEWVAGGFDILAPFLTGWLRVAHYPERYARRRGGIERVINRDLEGLKKLAEFDRALLNDENYWQRLLGS